MPESATIKPEPVAVSLNVSPPLPRCNRPGQDTAPDYQLIHSATGMLGDAIVPYPLPVIGQQR